MNIPEKIRKKIEEWADQALENDYSSAEYGYSLSLERIKEREKEIKELKQEINELKSALEFPKKMHYKVRSKDRQFWYGTFKTKEEAIKELEKQKNKENCEIIEVNP